MVEDELRALAAHDDRDHREALVALRREGDDHAFDPAAPRDRLELVRGDAVGRLLLGRARRDADRDEHVRRRQLVDRVGLQPWRRGTQLARVPVRPLGLVEDPRFVQRAEGAVEAVGRAPRGRIVVARHGAHVGEECAQVRLRGGAIGARRGRRATGHDVAPTRDLVGVEQPDTLGGQHHALQARELPGALLGIRVIGVAHPPPQRGSRLERRVAHSATRNVASGWPSSATSSHRASGGGAERKLTCWSPSPPPPPPGM